MARDLFIRIVLVVRGVFVHSAPPPQLQIFYDTGELWAGVPGETGELSFWGSCDPGRLWILREGERSLHQVEEKMRKWRRVVWCRQRENDENQNEHKPLDQTHLLSNRIVPPLSELYIEIPCNIFFLKRVVLKGVQKDLKTTDRFWFPQFKSMKRH